MARLDDLDDDCLMQVLDRLSPEELFQLQRLNQRLDRLAGIKMRVKVVAMSLWVSNTFFSKCAAHLGVVTRDQVMCLIPALAAINSKSELIMDALNRVEGRTSAIGRAMLLDVFSKCSSIKSVNFELPGDLLLEVVQFCPEIECIKFSRLVEQDEWCRVLNLIGHRLVHIVKDEYNAMENTQVWPLLAVAAKCPNIKQIDWQVNDYLTRDWMMAIKRLPKNCRVNIIRCYSIEVNFEDVVDELSLYCFPPDFNRRTERLSKLKFITFNTYHYLFILDDDVVGTEFAGLKKLDFSDVGSDENLFARFLVVSRFPRLEEFCLNVSVDWKEEDYEAMFARITTVKRLTLVCEKPMKLPQSAIRRLKKLETIAFEMRHVPGDNQQAELLQKVEYYIKEVDSLKKVIVEPDYDSCEKKNWQQTFKDGIEKVKQEQSRVSVEFKT